MTTDKKPIYYTMAEAADMIGWSTDRTRHFLKQNKAAKKLGTRWLTSKSLLRTVFSDTWDEIVLNMADDD